MTTRTPTPDSTQDGGLHLLHPPGWPAPKGYANG